LTATSPTTRHARECGYPRLPVSQANTCDILLNRITFFSEDILRRLLLTTCGVKITQFDDFLNSIVEVLSLLYAMRLSDRDLSLDLRWIPFESCLSRNDDGVSLDHRKYVDRLLQANSKYPSKEKFLQRTTDYRATFKGDYKMHVRGHDFVTLLAWSIKNFNGIKDFSKEAIIERLFIGMADKVPGIAFEIALRA
jgi:hypothetical protein